MAVEEGHETSGVDVELLATVDLGPEIEGMDGFQLRIRKVTMPAVEVSVDVVRAGRGRGRTAAH